MTITMEAKEVEHVLIFCSFTVAVIALCFIAWIFEKNK
jgi:hypothetical protein